SFVFMRPVRLDDLATDQYQDLEEKTVAVAEAAYKSREVEFGVPLMRDLERHVYLYTLDEHWRDHLYELDHLTGGIGLRAYGQGDPVIDDKNTAFTLVDTTP